MVSVTTRWRPRSPPQDLHHNHPPAWLLDWLMRFKSFEYVLHFYEDHAVSCAGIVGIKHRHNVVRDTLVDICYRSRISAGKEVDIGTSPLTQTGMAYFMPGRALIDVAQRKREADAVTLLKQIRKLPMARDIGARVA
ncbi:hypothetical protein Tco_1198239, partial [Tanacetum coccineum]